MLKNDAIDNPMLMSAFEFVKNVSKLEKYYLILYVFVVYEILMYFILIYRLAMPVRLVFRPKFVNLVNLILSFWICHRVYLF